MFKTLLGDIDLHQKGAGEKVQSPVSVAVLTKARGLATADKGPWVGNCLNLNLN